MRSREKSNDIHNSSSALSSSLWRRGDTEEKRDTWMTKRRMKYRREFILLMMMTTRDNVGGVVVGDNDMEIHLHLFLQHDDNDVLVLFSWACTHSQQGPRAIVHSSQQARVKCEQCMLNHCHCRCLFVTIALFFVSVILLSSPQPFSRDMFPIIV